MNDNQNLTTGNVPIKLIVFALPLLAANLLQSFYGLVDMVVVGRIVGENGLAAISNASMISFIINSVCIGITMGGTVLAAQYKGAKDECGQIETIGTLFTISLIAAVLVTAAGLSAYGPLFQILKDVYKRQAAARHTDHGSSLDILGDNGSDMDSEHCVNAVHGSLRANPLSPLGAFLIRLEEQPYRSRNLVLVFI